MKKQIDIRTHTDFDGAVFPYFVEKLAEIYSEKRCIKYELSIKYCDANNANEILSEDFEKFKELSRLELENIYYLVSDVPNLGQYDMVKDMVCDMQQIGLKVSYIDHHSSEDSKKLNEQLDCMYYMPQNTMCASMMGFSIILKCFMDAENIKDMDELLKDIGIQDKSLRQLLKDNEQSLENEDPKKILHQQNYFKNLFDIKESDIKDKKIQKLLCESAKLFKAADFLDRHKVLEMEDLDVVRDYFNLAVEHLGSDLSRILASIQALLSLPSNDELWTRIKKLIKDLEKQHKVKERIDETITNVEFISVKSKNGLKKYNFAVFFAEGDIRYNIERLRSNLNEVFEKSGMEPINVDGVITATRFGVGGIPVMTFKPTNTDANILVIAHDSFQNSKIIRGVNAGIPIEYAKNSYETIKENRMYVLKNTGENEHCIEVDRRRVENKEILEKMLGEIFDFEFVEVSRKEKLGKEFDFAI